MAIQRFEQEEKAKQELAASLEKIMSITPESLIRAQELGTSLNFENGKPAVERTVRLFRDLHKANLDNVPLDILNKLKTRVDSAVSHFKQIQDFNPGALPNPAAARDQLIQNIASEYDQHYQIITPVLSYSIRKGTDFEALEKAARDTVADIKKAAQDEKEQADKHLKDIMETVEKVRRAAAEVGVAQHAIHFQEQAKEHYKNSNKWLWATAILGLITFAFGVFNVFNLLARIETLTPVQSIQLVIAKVIIFSILYSSAVWSGRIYKSQWHNYVINKHRQNALSTFETFVKAASDEGTKNSVLLQATRSIFSCQPSGFISSSDLPENPQILEIIRGISNIKSPQ